MPDKKKPLRAQDIPSGGAGLGHVVKFAARLIVSEGHKACERCGFADTKGPGCPWCGMKGEIKQ